MQASTESPSLSAEQNEAAPALTVEHVIATTDFKKKWQARGAIETLAWLEAGAPHKLDGLLGRFRFDMASFVNPGSCGTACCMAGAIFQFSRSPERHLFCVSSRLDDVFGIPSNGAHPLARLFYAGNADESIVSDDPDYEDIDAPRAASTLRHYLTTGKVDWNIGEARG